MQLEPRSKWAVLKMTATELRDAQQEDPTLAIARGVAEGNKDGKDSTIKANCCIATGNRRGTSMVRGASNK